MISTDSGHGHTSLSMQTQNLNFIPYGMLLYSVFWLFSLKEIKTLAEEKRTLLVELEELKNVSKVVLQAFFVFFSFSLGSLQVQQPSNSIFLPQCRDSLL